MKDVFSKIWEFIKKGVSYLLVAVIAIITLIAGADELFISKQELEDMEYARQTFQDGSYFAEVSYRNKCTGFKNYYELDVDIKRDTLSCIHFENGGYLNKSHIIPQIVSDDGKVVIKNKDGCSEYRIQIISSD